MDEITIDRAEVLDELLKAAQGREDYVYVAPDAEGGCCVYYEYESYSEHAGSAGVSTYLVPVGTPHPSCLVGHVIDNLAERLDRPDLIKDVVLANNSDTGVQEFVADLAGIGLVFTPSAVDVLNIAQSHQDQGVPWGEAIRRAKEGIR